MMILLKYIFSTVEKRGDIIQDLKLKAACLLGFYLKTIDCIFGKFDTRQKFLKKD